MSVRTTTPTFDIAIAAALVAACPSWIARAGDLIGSLPVIGAVVGVLLAIAVARRRWSDALAVTIGAGAEVPTELLKAIINRPRPPSAHEIEALGSIASYPSGHVVRTVVVAGLVVALLAGRGRIGHQAAVAGAGIIAGLVAFARIGAGAHWPTDVLGGILLGCAWLSVALVARKAAVPA